jgi:hypothetical protein
VFVIDELERSMHPALARKLVETFLWSHRADTSQLIFTTHETHLLDLELLRRDGIWFVEKDLGGASALYSLADFKIRKDLRLEKSYLQGRFGAIPFLGGIDHLIEEEREQEQPSGVSTRNDAPWVLARSTGRWGRRALASARWAGRR